jgi:peptidoglycan/LPS O-acetylase OafA/YrhL
MALLVVFSHSFALATGRPFAGLTTVSPGAFGRAVFFVVSGFLVARSWERSKGAADFLHRRVRRLLPAYVVAFALSAWVVAPLASDRPASWLGPEGVGTNLGRLALLHHVEGDAFRANPYPSKVNGSLWTLRFEFGFYVLVAGAGLAGMISRPRAVIAAFAGIWGLMLLAAWKTFDTRASAGVAHVLGHPWNWIEFGTWFWAGVTAYALRDLVRYPGWGAALAAAAVGWTLVRQDGSHIYVWPVAVPYLTLWVAFTPRVRLNGAVRRLGGDYSYGVFLYSFPIQQACVAWLGCAGRPWLLFAVAVPLSLAAAVLSWRCIERPAPRRPRTTAGPSTGALPALSAAGAATAATR